MRVYNSFIAMLGICLTLITVVMAVNSVNTIDLYFTVFTITLLVLTTLYIYLSPRARRELNGVGVAAFGGFMVIVAVKVFEILSRK